MPTGINVGQLQSKSGFMERQAFIHFQVRAGRNSDNYDSFSHHLG